MSTVAPPAVARVCDAMCDLPTIRAMCYGGSGAAGLADDASDIDIHVYWTAPLADLAERAARLEPCADSGSVRLDVRSWGLEDWLWVGGRKIELVYLYLPDMEAEVERAYGPGLDTDSSTTALLYIVAAGQPCYDPDGVWQAMQQRLNAGYPEPTRRLLLSRRAAGLRYLVKDIKQAQGRGDLLFVQAQRSALHGLYFNLLFALNRRFHPGGKRLLVHAERCPLRPPELRARWSDFVLLRPDDPGLIEHAEILVADLLELLAHSDVAPRSEVW